MLKKETGTLIVVSSIITFIGAIFTPFYITYIQSLNGSLLFAGSSLALFSILIGIFLLFSGKIERNYAKKKNLIGFGYTIKGLSFIIVGLSVSNPSLILGLVLMSIGTAFSLPAFDSLYTRYADHKDSSIQWADLQAVAYIITGIAALVGTILIENFGFREIFISLGILALLTGAYVFTSKNL